MKVKVLPIFLFALVASAFLFLPTKKAYAWPWDVFTQIGESFSPSNIRKTMVNATVSVATDAPSQALYGRNLDQLDSCMDKLSGNKLNLPPPPEGADLSTTDDCTDLQVATPITGKQGFPTQTRSLGSVMGLATILEDVTQNEDPIINMAAYTKHMAAKIPVLNQTAYAAEGSDTFLAIFVNVWEQVRNLSYGILALFMVAIGIMIMMRHKINPQSVVTVQYAIPRIIIAVILITFSYPIGALAFSAVIPLSKFAYTLIQTDSGISASLQTLPTTTIGTMLSTLFWNGLAGVGALIVRIIAGVVFFYLIIRLLIQIALSWVKIAISTIAAPVIFAWGAIPGNENITIDWFKGLAVNALSVPAMLFMLGLNRYVQIAILERTLAGNGPVLFGSLTDAANASYLTFFAVSVIQLVVLLEALKIPAKLEEVVNGGSKGGKR